jgi:hypothetical protein
MYPSPGLWRVILPHCSAPWHRTAIPKGKNVPEDLYASTILAREFGSIGEKPD